MTIYINKCADRTLKLIALFCILAVGFAVYSQHYMGMRPCAWCVLQRFIFIVIAVICLIASNHRLNTLYKNIFSIIAMIAAISGIIAAWYQYSVAAEMFSCAQTFADKFITTSNLDIAMPWLFGVYATCMDAKVSLMGIEYAIWGLMLFIACAILIALSIIARRNHGTRSNG